MLIETLVNELALLENFFYPINWRIGPKIGQNSIFLNLKRNYSVMKISIICCVFAQILYLRKTLFPRYRPKCSQPIRLQDFLINYFSRTNWWNSLVFCMLIQIHESWIWKLIEIFCLGMVKNRCGKSGLRTLEWIDGINWFFASW